MSATVERPVGPDQSRRAAIRALPDALAVVVLGTAAALLRRHFPADGWFYDDAWQTLGASKGSISQLPIVGQTQPGFTLELMAWDRIAGAGGSTMVVPALVAGVLGPPAVYLLLRQLGYARSVCGVLGALVVVAPTHIIFSTRVKSYTTDVLVMVVLTLVVARLATRRWGRPTAVAWFAGSVLLASFSSFALLGAAAAGAILVLHPCDDRRLRIVTVAAQLLAHLAFLRAVSTRYNERLVADFFRGKGGFVEFDPNPVEFGRTIVVHFLRVISVFPGVDDPTWWALACLLAAGLGLVAIAWRGPHATSGRFLVLSVLFAFGGSLVGLSPFGTRAMPPIGGGGRVTLWLIPAVAVGLATVLEGARRAVSERHLLRAGFDVLAFGLVVLLFAGAVGEGHAYPLLGARDGTRYVMDHLEEGDVVWITRYTSYSFALYAETPLRIRATPERSIGFLPDFVDPRLHIIDFDPDPEALRASVEGADSLYVIHANVQRPGDPNFASYRLGLAVALKSAGFERERSDDMGRTTVDTWRREVP